MIAGILPPGRGEPIGRGAHDVRSADNPAKEAWASGHLQAGWHLVCQFLDDNFPVFRIFGKGAAQDFLHFRVGFEWPLRERSDVIAKFRGGVCRDTQDTMIYYPSLQRFLLT
jgi:hypothetical protein